MGKTFRVLLKGHCVYSCVDCGTHLTHHDELVSTSFRGRTGQAWLFGKVVNVSEGQHENRDMTTGRHTIVDVFCNECGSNLGWRYEEAFEESQKYKKGKFILEKALLRPIDTDMDDEKSPQCSYREHHSSAMDPLLVDPTHTDSQSQHPSSPGLPPSESDLPSLAVIRGSEGLRTLGIRLLNQDPDDRGAGVMGSPRATNTEIPEID